MILRVVALFAAVLVAASCSSAKTYEMRGQVLGINRDKLEILVKHEEIEGLMPAMTMPWKVRTANTDAPAPGGPAPPGVKYLMPGDEVPNQMFVDQDGRSRDFGAIRAGRA